MLVGLDLETFPFSPGNMAPPVVCVSIKIDDEEPRLYSVSEALPVLSDLLNKAGNKQAIIIGHHIAYDMACIASQYPQLIPAVFKAYDNDGIADTMLNAKLVDLAKGEIAKSYALDKVLAEYTNFSISKDVDIRTGYDALADKPINEWPAEAVKYALDDTRYLIELYRKQHELAEKELPDLFYCAPRECRSAFALQLM